MDVTGNISKAKGLASDLTQEQIKEIANQLRTFFASEEFRQLWSEDTFYKNTAIWKSVLEKLNKKVDAEDGKGLSSNDFTKYEQEALAGAIQAIESVGKALDGYQKKLTFDSTPTSGSKNPVTSAGIERALAKKADIVDLNSYQTKLTFDETPTDGSSNPVTSGGIKKELDKKVNAKDDKGLSTNDFTNAEKEQLSKLKGAYVFIGSYGSINEVALVVPDQILKYTPVFNYLGEDVEFSQPYNHTPYVVNVLDQGVKEISSGVFKNYLSISQDEAIIFKVGMPVSIHVLDGEYNSFTVNDTIHTIIFGNNVNINRTTADLILENTSSDIVGTTVTGIDCSPTVTIRTGDNVAVLHIAGRNFFEVLSHDYGEEMNVWQEEYKVMNAQVQTKADKQMAVPSTVKTGNPLVLSDQLAGESLLSFQIHGADGGVGDLTDSGKYQIPIKLYGKNLVNSSIFAADFDLQEDGSYRANKNLNTARKYPLSLPAGTYTISYTVKAPTSFNCRISFELADGTKKNGYISASTGEYKQVTKAFTFTSPIAYLYWEYSTPTADISFYDLQIEAGSIRTDYEPYHAYETKIVLVDAPLGAGETVAVDGMVARDGVSTYVAETSVSPILSIGYYRDINKVIAGLQAMILEA